MSNAINRKPLTFEYFRRLKKSGQYSTDAAVLESLAEKHDLPRRIIDYRTRAKLKSTYADALPRLIHPATGRLHTRLSQTGAATGRLSSSNPNLQNIPVRTELGREVRAGYEFAVIDTLGACQHFADTTQNCLATAKVVEQVD